MADQQTPSSNETTIPLSLVFITIGGIILMTVFAIWLIAPATMPQPLYNLVSNYLPQRQPAPIAAPIAAQSSPLANDTSQTNPTATPILSLLPETSPNDEETAYPDYFVSAKEAARDAQTPIAGQPQRIVIPTINLDASIIDVGLEEISSNGQTYYQWRVPKTSKGGWHNNSALLGKAGNTVINGHHNIHGEIFRDLVKLKEGDEIILYDATDTFTYRITTKEILEERGQSLETRIANAQWIEPTDDERITLVTCWPYTDNSHRVIVVAEPVTKTVDS